MKNITPKSVWQNPWHFITFGFGIGAMPFAPGTFATLAAMPFYLLLAKLPLLYYLIALIIIIIIASWLCEKTCKEIGVHDHPGTVIDEYVGYFVTMIAVPYGWGWMLGGFILFRFFDILKPQPIRWLDENIHGGIGVILDDVVAGIAACVILHFIVWMF